MQDQLAEHLIRVPNADAPIYRIFPLWFLEEALRLRRLVLVRPAMWEDPYEVVAEEIVVPICRRGWEEQEIITPPPAFAQCWSATAESDTLLRAYSRVVKDPYFRRNICPRDEGVQVKSTPRKLLQAVMAEATLAQYGDWFLGAVKYLQQKELMNEIGNAIRQQGLDVFSVPSNRAELLLLKRHAFSHEAEMRLIYVRRIPGPPELIQVPVDFSVVFDEISFDPRLELFERKERVAVFRDLGFEGPIRESCLYHRPVLLVSGLEGN